MKRGLFAVILIISLFVFPFSSQAQGVLSVSGMELGQADENGYFPVIEVYPGSPADVAGIVEMDLLVDMDHVSIRGMSPFVVENMLSSRLGSGRSSVLTLLGSGGKVLAWLRPANLSIAQQETLDFYQKLINFSKLSDSHWKHIRESFRAWISNDQEASSLKEQIDISGQSIWSIKQQIIDIELPLHVSDRTGSLCSELRHHYIGVQNLRFDARGKMVDYAIHRWGDKLYLEERWSNLVSATEEAERQNRKAGFYSDKLLRSIEVSGQDFVSLMQE